MLVPHNFRDGSAFDSCRYADDTGCLMQWPPASRSQAFICFKLQYTLVMHATVHHTFVIGFVLLHHTSFYVMSTCNVPHFLFDVIQEEKNKIYVTQEKVKSMHYRRT